MHSPRGFPYFFRSARSPKGCSPKFALSDKTFNVRTVAEVQRLYVRHGATEVCARIATRRIVAQGLSDHGWQRGLERAQLARQLGLQFNPEFGLFAEYGDARNYQQPPDFSDFPEIRLSRPWPSLELGEMAHALRQYGAIMARKILATGARVVMWDIGNEVQFGIAGVTPHPLIGDEHYAPPDAVDPEIGRMSVYRLISKMTRKADRLVPGTSVACDRSPARRNSGWYPFGRPRREVQHAYLGLRAENPSARFAFWQSMKEAGYLHDQFGISFYVAGTPPPDGTDDMLQ